MVAATRAAVVMGLLMAFAPTPAHSGAGAGSLEIRFDPGVIEPPPDRSAGALDEFIFRSSGLRSALADAGVEYLAREFPRFKREDRDSRNFLGEGPPGIVRCCGCLVPGLVLQARPARV